MRRRPSNTLVGAFVVGAVALAALGITALGSGRLFQKRFTCVLYFSGSSHGLSVGSPIEFKGVKVGEVTKISVVLDPKAVSITIPVYVELDPNSLIVLGDLNASKVLATNRFYAYALPFVWIAPPEKQKSGIDLHVSRRVRIARPGQGKDFNDLLMGSASRIEEGAR